MTIHCIAVGKRLPPELSQLCADYERRLKQWAQVEWSLIPHSKARTPVSATKDESERLTKTVAQFDFVVLLDERGQQFDSVALSERLMQWREDNKSLAFVIGGAYGVTDEFRGRCNEVWSMSSLVFPHEIMRLLVLEQLYRAHAIYYGLPYHHA